MPTLWLNLIKELVWPSGSSGDTNELGAKKSKRSIGSIFMLVVRLAMGWFLFILVSQQTTLVNLQWSIKTIQYEKACQEYAHHKCVQMQTTNVQFITECERLSVVMRVSPFSAAITSVVNEWNTCITMPCTQLVRTIATHSEYKILFILVSIGVFYYAAKFFSFTREKAVDFQDMLRVRETRKYMKQMASQQQQQQRQQSSLIK